MRTALKALAATSLLLLVLAGGYAAYVAATGIPRYAPQPLDVHLQTSPERVARGRKFARLLCVGCHMDPTTRQLTGKRIADLSPQYGTIYSKNITRDPDSGIGAWTDGELMYFMRTGVNRRGQYVPPYMPKLPLLADDDLESIVAFLRSDDPLVASAAVDPPGVTRPSFLTKLLAHLLFKPLPLPTSRIETPSPDDTVAYGRYLSANLGCFTCHSVDFKSMNEFEPEKSGGYMGGGNALLDLNGDTIVAPNITFDASTGIGQWSVADFTRALRSAVRPDGRVLLYPMVPMPDLTEQDAAALYAYLATVPKIAHAVPRRVERAALADASAGKQAYYRYGCVSCHGANGIGIADLRQANQHHPTDAGLTAWIRNPAALKPGTQMPAWEGVIPDSEMPALIAYVRELGRNR